MGIVSDLSGMIEALGARAAPHDALSSSQKLITLENEAWRLPDKPRSTDDPLPRHGKYGDDISNLPGIIDRSEVVMNFRTVSSKVHSAKC